MEAPDPRTAIASVPDPVDWKRREREAIANERAKIRRRRASLDTSEFSWTAKRVLVVLQLHWRFSEGGNCWKTMQKLADEIRRPLAETRRAVHELRDAGVVSHQPMVDGWNYQPAGSGYFLAVAWDIL